MAMSEENKTPLFLAADNMSAVYTLEAKERQMNEHPSAWASRSRSSVTARSAARLQTQSSPVYAAEAGGAPEWLPELRSLSCWHKLRLMRDETAFPKAPNQCVLTVNSDNYRPAFYLLLALSQEIISIQKLYLGNTFLNWINYKSKPK